MEAVSEGGLARANFSLDLRVTSGAESRSERQPGVSRGATPIYGQSFAARRWLNGRGTARLARKRRQAERHEKTCLAVPKTCLKLHVLSNDVF